jgi:hypothetical protein
MTRIGYDADTSQYTFRDEQGTIYRGAPRSEYGTLTPVTSSQAKTDNESSQPRPKVSIEATGPAPTTFHDILPASCITSPSSSADPNIQNHPSPPSTHSLGSSTQTQFISAVRKTALPKMQGVVQNLRRSMTMASKKTSTQQTGEDGDKLLGQHSHESSEKTTLSRSASSVTSRSSVSTSTPMSDTASPQQNVSKVE